MRVIEESSRKCVLKARLRFDIYGIITDRLWLRIGYCIFVKAFCFDESTSAFIVLTILSCSSFIFCITALNILSIISFIESVLATRISFLEYSLSYLYTFLSRYIWRLTLGDPFSRNKDNTLQIHGVVLYFFIEKHSRGRQWERI